MASKRLPEPPQRLDLAVESAVLRDLEPPIALVHVKAAAAAILGSLLSLAVCGQFGIGFTSLADAFSHAIHAEMGLVPCALICGALFAIFPVALLRLALCNVIQFRAIFRRHFNVMGAWFAGVGGIMAWQGHHGDKVLQFGAWIFAALLAAVILGRLAGACTFPAFDAPDRV